MPVISICYNRVQFLCISKIYIFINYSKIHLLVNISKIYSYLKSIIVSSYIFENSDKDLLIHKALEMTSLLSKLSSRSDHDRSRYCSWDVYHSACFLSLKRTLGGFLVEASNRRLGGAVRSRNSSTCCVEEFSCFRLAVVSGNSEKVEQRHRRIQ